MWGTFLSEPLSIVVLVGRYPANKLMERIPIGYRNSLITKRCLLECYGELVPISQCYAPVKGRLHTRYAPVRRSQISKLILPLDLHVLSLPLAFILSQDQTLHRILFAKLLWRIF